MSKSLAPGLRLGWLVVPDRLVDPVARQKGETEETSGFVDQLAMAEFIVSGSYDRHIRTMRAEYSRRREQLVAAVGPGIADDERGGNARGAARDARARRWRCGARSPGSARGDDSASRASTFIAIPSPLANEMVW